MNYLAMNLISYRVKQELKGSPRLAKKNHDDFPDLSPFFVTLNSMEEQN